MVNRTHQMRHIRSMGSKHMLWWVEIPWYANLPHLMQPIRLQNSILSQKKNY